MLNQDELGKISDDELHRRYRTVKGWITSRKFSTAKTRNLEVELCYLHRETEIREARRIAHQHYLAERKKTRIKSRRTA